MRYIKTSTAYKRMDKFITELVYKINPADRNQFLNDLHEITNPTGRLFINFLNKKDVEAWMVELANSELLKRSEK